MAQTSARKAEKRWRSRVPALGQAKRETKNRRRQQVKCAWVDLFAHIKNAGSKLIETSNCRQGNCQSRREPEQLAMDHKPERPSAEAPEQWTGQAEHPNELQGAEASESG